MTYNDALPDVPAPLAHNQPVFKELEILAIFELFKVETSKFVFDCLTTLLMFLIQPKVETEAWSSPMIELLATAFSTLTELYAMFYNIQSK